MLTDFKSIRGNGTSYSVKYLHKMESLQLKQR
jgi:hypothetical protein